MVFPERSASEFGGVAHGLAGHQTQFAVQERGGIHGDRLG